VLDKVLTAAATNVKLALAAVAGAALVAGGSAVAISNVADTSSPATASQASRQDAADAHGSDDSTAKGASRSDTATATLAHHHATPSDTPTAGTHPKRSKAGNHGACVSAAAHATTATGRARGQGIATIAKSDCGKTARPARSPKSEPSEAAEHGEQGDAGEQGEQGEHRDSHEGAHGQQPADRDESRSHGKDGGGEH
jgi:hypothetical protein